MHGLINWFARNSVAANLLMVFIIAWGLMTLATRLPLEVFPSFELEVVTITVPFRGATPSEVESGVTIKIEEAIQDLSGISQITSRASEGSGRVSVQFEKGVDLRAIKDDIEQRVASIGNLPLEADAPTVSIPVSNREVISVIVSGALPERELRVLASRVRDELEALPDVTQVELSGVRDYELAIEIKPATLQRYDLTLSDVAQAIETTSLDLAAGSVQTVGGRGPS